jgi:hypothetical protein
MRLRAFAFRFRMALAGLSGTAALAGCGTTPTLPLPPPIAVAGAPNAQGLVLVTGRVNDEAYVSVMNERTKMGVFEEADELGYYEVEIAAVVGDRLTVWQERDGLEGERALVVVPAP